MAEVCLTFEHVSDMQRQYWGRKFETEPPIQITVSAIRNEFETDGSVCTM
jgi:hypothetical protein